MTTWVHNPALLSHANGYTLGNTATTDAAAGTVLTCALSTGGTVKYQSSTWEHIGAAGAARLDMSVGTSSTILVEYLVDLVTLPTGTDSRLIEIRHASNYLARVVWRPSGEIRLASAANATLWTSASTYSSGTRVRIMVGADPGTTTSNGRLIIGVYSGSSGLSTTPDETVYDSSAVNAGTADITAVRFGRVNSDAGSTATVRTVNIQAKDTGLTPIGPLLEDPELVVSTEIAHMIDLSASTGVTFESIYLDDGPSAPGYPWISSEAVTVDQAKKRMFVRDSPARTGTLEMTVGADVTESPTALTYFVEIPVVGGTTVKRIGRLFNIGGTAH